ncbi:ABC transporter ATP-binding protein [Achromobacter insolitus]|uniref:Putative iron export ATP-binding protein FetA n=1 Tax=Achromobacter insolitus TaxID=217204 RepID=A0A6S7EZ67_9BURK|nr:ATP-binding cassette domain-containing protein [Achromobacter insolitus]MDQ6212863.1 ATP-binding cassette domain-containing protein [Achromobacter insolitus]NGT15247.1 ATP-binding cassette domain-containing protein [Achromobacter insolitus]QEK93244.1 ATP-binding cassette domain-containing protein [Achromobacter insolitus]CAB3929253.1 putative iron export ATP-binding protein FetA [Achromobacter insolitus]CAB3944388.1 putative iron export ATP-binding protein FetA [Achromobacter insolitus]
MPNITIDAHPLLRLRGIYSERLAPASLDLAPGECAAIMGPSGSGKSLFLRQVADLDPGHGEALLDGRPRSGMRGYAWRRKVIYCQAEAGWWEDAVAPHFADRAKAAAIMQRLGLSVDKLDALVNELSTGERQRLGLARALALAPRVLLLDEPTAALDQAATDKVEAEVRRYLDSGAAVLMVTHSPAQAERLARRSWRMEQGRLEPLWT